MDTRSRTRRLRDALRLPVRECDLTEQELTVARLASIDDPLDIAVIDGHLTLHLETVRAKTEQVFADMALNPHHAYGLHSITQQQTWDAALKQGYGPALVKMMLDATFRHMPVDAMERLWIDYSNITREDLWTRYLDVDLLPAQAVVLASRMIDAIYKQRFDEDLWRQVYLLNDNETLSLLSSVLVCHLWLCREQS